MPDARLQRCRELYAAPVGPSPADVVWVEAFQRLFGVYPPEEHDRYPGADLPFPIDAPWDEHDDQLWGV